MNTPACGATPEAQALFSSPYLDAFDPQAFREEHGDVPKGVLESAKEEHDKTYYIYTGAAKQLCYACPMLEKCLGFARALNKADEIYGVLAGMTTPERDEFLSQEDNSSIVVGAAAKRLMGQ